MKKYKITALLTSAALLLCGCAQNNKSAESRTTTGQTTTAATSESAAETTASEATTSAATTEAVSEATTETAPEATEPEDNAAAYDSDPEKHPFRLGVWLVKDEEGSEYYEETYYCFREGGSGSFQSQSMGIGMGFNYEADSGSKVRYKFEIGAADNFSYMEIVDVDIDDNHFKAKWDGRDVIQDWTYLCPADGFRYYSNYSLGLMAEHLFGMSLESVENEIVETAFELGMISVIIRDPSVENYAQSILKWYFIDRYTGKGYDSEGNEVDLTKFEGEWAEMPQPDSFTG